MNLPSFTVQLPPVQEPPPPPRAREDEDYRTERDREADEAFDRALKDELDRKAPPPPPPFVPILPMMLPTPQLATGSSDAIAAATATSSVASAASRATSMVSQAGADAGQERAVDAAARTERPEDAQAQPIRLMVEAGLPPVQPSGDGQKVSLVDFPQVVVGQVRNLVHHNKPLTQLDFQISPPHVGPVNLQVSYTQGVVGVQLTALTLQAKQALEGQVGTIHQILTAHNLTPGQIRVVTAVGGRAGANGAGARADQGAFGFFNGGRRKPSGPDDGTVGTA